jgi:histone chaperone ASF1
MSLVNVLNVIVKQSKTPFTQPIAFDIYFESVKSLKHSLTWRIIYIGQASCDEYDQILEEAEMDCEVAGRMMFTLEGQFPDVSKLPQNDVVGVTAILMTCSYNGTQEFFRVGYYVNNAYSEEFPDLIENPPN